jgi:hypothetical protein
MTMSERKQSPTSDKLSDQTEEADEVPVLDPSTRFWVMVFASSLAAFGLMFGVGDLLIQWVTRLVRQYPF